MLMSIEYSSKTQCLNPTIQLYKIKSKSQAKWKNSSKSSIFKMFPSEIRFIKNQFLDFLFYCITLFYIFIQNITALYKLKNTKVIIFENVEIKFLLDIL